MGKKKIVIDTNLFISALGWGGKPNELIERAIDKEYELYISTKQIKELIRVLSYPRLKFTEHEKKAFLEKIYEIAIIIDTKLELSVVEDPFDNMLVECAVEADADYIISGDNLLKKLKKFKNIRIVSVSEFLEGD